MNDLNRFGTFTDEAGKAVQLAREEAENFRHETIGTAHLLLGLMREEESAAAYVLRTLGVGLQKVRSAVELFLGRGDQPVPGESELTPRLRQVIERAADEARGLHHSVISTGHLLLSLLEEQDGIAMVILDTFEVDLARVRTETSSRLEQR